MARIIKIKQAGEKALYFFSWAERYAINRLLEKATIVDAIKFYRASYCLGLKEAKDAVDAYMSNAYHLAELPPYTGSYCPLQVTVESHREVEYPFSDSDEYVMYNFVKNYVLELLMKRFNIEASDAVRLYNAYKMAAAS